MADRKLVVQIVGDDSQLQRTLNQSAQAVQKFGKSTGRASGVSTAHNFDSLLADVRASQAQADSILDKQDTQIGRLQTQQEKLITAAKVGGAFFAVGKVLSGAGGALEAFTGKTDSTTEALNDAGQAFQDLTTLDVKGFFQDVTASSRRSVEKLEAYNSKLGDVNQSQQALKDAANADALGFHKQAQDIRDHIQLLKNVKTAEDAINFGNRKANVDKTTGALVRFRGAGDSQGLRLGLGGAGGVGIEKATRDVGNITVEVKLDGEKIGSSTTKTQQKQRRRNGRQKRGPNTSPH